MIARNRSSQTGASIPAADEGYNLVLLVPLLVHRDRFDPLDRPVKLQQGHLSSLRLPVRVEDDLPDGVRLAGNSHLMPLGDVLADVPDRHAH